MFYASTQKGQKHNMNEDCTVEHIGALDSLVVLFDADLDVDGSKKLLIT